MDGKKKIGLLLVGKRRAPFERNEGIVGARIDHFRPHLRFNQFADALGNIQHQVFFDEPFAPSVPWS